MLEKLLEFIRSKIFEKIAIAIVFVNVIVVYILIYHMYSIIDYATLIRYCIFRRICASVPKERSAIPL